MTLLIASVHGEVPDQLEGANLLELRVDSFELQTVKEELPKLLGASPIPTVVTCRSVSEGGMFEGSEEERIEMYQVALQCAHPPRYIDIEYESFRRNPSMIEQLSSETTDIILSWHDVHSRPRNLLQRAQEMQQVQEADVVKIVWRARSIRDNIEAFELLQTKQKPMIAMCMGEVGVMSRILAPKFGGFATYASVEGMGQTATGQLTLHALRSIYNVQNIQHDTKVYGIIGNNVAHSASPQFHNAAFQVAGSDAVYLPFQIPDGTEHVKASFGELLHYEPLHFSGASVTIPHKEAMMQCVDSCDDSSVKVGATNTVTIANQQSSATNTDVTALTSLTHGSSKALVLGGGGVARAAIVALQTHGAEVFVATRRSEQSASLAKEFECNIAKEGIEDIDTIVHCTPIGMEGGEDPEGNPLQALTPWLSLTSSTRVIDTVYNPKETPLLFQANGVGCNVVYGEDMFRLQAAMQQQIWDS